MTMHNSARHERLLIAGSWLSLIGLVAAVTARQPAYIAVPLGVAAFSTYLCARHALALSGHTVPTDGALAVAYPIMAVGSLVGVFAAFVAVHEAGARITTVQLHGAYWAMLGIAWLLPTSIEASRAQRHESHRAARSRRPGSGPRRTGIPSHVAPPILINHLAQGRAIERSLQPSSLGTLTGGSSTEGDSLFSAHCCRDWSIARCLVVPRSLSPLLAATTVNPPRRSSTPTTVTTATARSTRRTSRRGSASCRPRSEGQEW